MGQEASITVRANPSLRLDVADLLRRPGASEPVHLSVHLDGLGLDLLSVPGEVETDLRLDGLADGVAVTGVLRSVAHGSCARCLAPIRMPVTAEVEEAFLSEPGPEGEAYRLGADQIDLEPMIRDAVLLALPLNPLCREGCAGLCPVCGEDRNRVACGHDGPASDPRWDALRDLLREDRDTDEEE